MDYVHCKALKIPNESGKVFWNDDQYEGNDLQTAVLLTSRTLSNVSTFNR